MYLSKKFIALVFCSIILVISIGAQQQGEISWSTLADSPWPMMKHDPQATGRSPYVGPKSPNIVWTMDMPYGVFSGPAIGPENNLFFGTHTWLPGHSSNYFYSAYPDGTIRWTFNTSETFATDSGFLIGSDSTVYFGSEGGYVYAVTLEGDIKWKYFAGDNVYQEVMNIDLYGNIYFSSADGYLHSVNKFGELNWKINFNGAFLSRSVVLSPDGETIYVSPRDGNLYALNLDSSIKWVYSSGPVRAVPLVDNEGHIYITPDGYPAEIHSINTDGTSNWVSTYTEYGAISRFSSPTMDGFGNIYFVHWVSFASTYAITSVDYSGNFRWTYILETEEEFGGITQPLVCDKDGTLYFGSTLGYFYYAISSEGELLWKFPLNGYEVDNSTAIGSDGTLYIGTHLSSTSTGQEKTLIAVRDTGATSVDNEVFLNKYILHQNYPNPFNPSTIIKYQLSNSGIVTLKVYDILGRKVTTLINEFKSAGSYEINFSSEGLSSGVYIYRITANNGRILFSDSKKMILLR